MYVAYPDITTWLQSQASLSSHVYTLNACMWNNQSSGCYPKCCFNQSEMFFPPIIAVTAQYSSTRSLLHIPNTNQLESCPDNLNIFSYFLTAYPQVKHFRALQEQASTYLDLVCSVCDLSDESVRATAAKIQETKRMVSLIMQHQLILLWDMKLYS